MKVELVSTEGCGLCSKADMLLQDLQKEYRFDLKHTLLTDDHPQFGEWHIAVPIVIIDGTQEIKGRITEEDMRSVFRSLHPSPPASFISRIKRALGAR